MDLKEAVKNLAQLQRNLEESKAWEVKCKEKLSTLPEYKEFMLIKEEQATIKAAMDEARTQVKADAVAGFIDTGEKAPLPGVAVKIYKKLDYDMESAKDYCIKHLQTALKLNMSLFNKYLKATEQTNPLDFVIYKEEPGAAISKDLSEYLK